MAPLCVNKWPMLVLSQFTVPLARFASIFDADIVEAEEYGFANTWTVFRFPDGVANTAFAVLRPGMTDVESFGAVILDQETAVALQISV